MTRGGGADRIARVREGRHAEKVGYPIRIRETEVVRTGMIGAGLLRVTLGGPGIEGFEAHSPCVSRAAA